jgi:nucleotide-binding universal stress UspA family protein
VDRGVLRRWPVAIAWHRATARAASGAQPPLAGREPHGVRLATLGVEGRMKAIVAIDRSPCCRHVIDNVCRRAWPADSEIELLTVLASRVPLITEPTLVLAASHEFDLQVQERAASDVLGRAAGRIRASRPDLRVTERIAEGPAAKTIVAEGQRWDADVIIMGSRGRGRLRRLLFGSVSDRVAWRASCAVQVVHRPQFAR